jgi:TP901 family phage tail tape measure protein
MAGVREIVFDIFAIDRASRTLSKVGAEADLMGGKLGGAGKMAATGLLAASAVTIGLGLESIRMAGNFEAAVTRLATSAGESQKNLGMVGQGMLDMAGKVGYSAVDLAKGMYVVESAGYHGAKGLEILKAAAQGARTENADLGTVANAVSTVMVDFGTKAGSAAQVTSTLIAAVAAGKTNFQDLSGAMHAVMPRAAALHMSFPELAADLATMTSHGMSAEQSAQNLNGALRQLSAPTLQMSKVMSDFGIQSHDVSMNLSKRGLQGTLEMLSSTIMSQMGPAGTHLKTVFNQSKLAAQDAALMFSGLSPELQKVARDYQLGNITAREWTLGLKTQSAPNANLLKQWAVMENASKGFSQTLKSGGDSAKTYVGALSKMVGGQEATTVALMLTGDQAARATANIKSVSAATVDAGGNVAGFALQQQTLNGKLQDARGAWDSLLTQLGGHLLPVAKAVVGVFTQMVGSLKDHQTAILVTGAAILSLTALMGTIKVGMLAWRGVQMIATGATMAMTAAQWLLNAALTANPIGIVIVLIAALVAGIVIAYTHSKTFHKIVDEAFHGIATAGKWMWDTVLKPVFNEFATVVKWLWGNIIKPYFTLIVTELRFMAAVWLWLADQAIRPIVQAIGNVVMWLWRNAISPALNGIKADLHVAGQVFSWLYSNAIRPMATQAVSAFNSVKSGLSSAWAGLSGIASSAFYNIVGAIRGPINAIIGMVNAMIRSLNGVRITVPSVDIPGVGKVGGASAGFNIPNIPYLAQGGIVTRPTVAMIGEAGPEAIIPLSHGRGLGGGDTYNIHVSVPPGADQSAVGATVERALVQLRQRRGGAPLAFA